MDGLSIGERERQDNVARAPRHHDVHGKNTASCRDGTPNNIPQHSTTAQKRPRLKELSNTTYI